MTEPTELRRVLEEASGAINHYKHPDVDEAREWINKLLAAGKLGGIGSDKIDDIRISGGMVAIYTSYSVRSCLMDDKHEFPEHVLDAEDPIDAISAWAWGERVGDAQEKVDEALRLLDWSKEELAKAQAELHQAMSS